MIHLCTSSGPNWGIEPLWSHSWLILCKVINDLCTNLCRSPQRVTILLTSHLSLLSLTRCLMGTGTGAHGNMEKVIIGSGQESRSPYGGTGSCLAYTSIIPDSVIDNKEDGDPFVSEVSDELTWMVTVKDAADGGVCLYVLWPITSTISTNVNLKPPTFPDEQQDLIWFYTPDYSLHLKIQLNVGFLWISNCTKKSEF